MSIECIKYIPINKGTCAALASVYVSNWGIEIHGISLHRKEDQSWINLPSREYENNGEKKYAGIVYFRDKSKHKLFCEKVKESIKEFNKNDLKEEQMCNVTQTFF